MVMGWLADKLGPRFVVTFFGSFLGIGLLLLSTITQLWQFTILHGLVLCLGTSTSSVPIMSTVSRWFSKRRSLMSGVVQSGVGIGGFVISPVTGWLIASHGWRTAYVVLGIIGLLGIVISGLLVMGLTWSEITHRYTGSVFSFRLEVLFLPVWSSPPPPASP